MIAIGRRVASGVVALGALCCVGCREPLVTDLVAARGDDLARLHRSLDRVRDAMAELDAHQQWSWPAPPAPLDPRPRMDATAWNCDYLLFERLGNRRERFPREGSPPLYLETELGLGRVVEWSARGDAAAAGANEERNENGEAALAAACAARYAVVFRYLPGGRSYRDPVQCALVDLGSGELRDLLTLTGGESASETESRIRRHLATRWDTEMTRDPEPPWFRARIEARGGGAWIFWALPGVLLLVSMVLAVRASNRALMEPVRAYAARLGLDEVGSSRFLGMDRFPWAAGTVEGRRVAYSSRWRRRLPTIGLIEVEARVPAGWRGCVRVRQSGAGPEATPILEASVPDPSGLLDALDAAGGEALVRVLTPTAACGETRLELEQGTLRFHDEPHPYMVEASTRARFEEATARLLALAARIEAAGAPDGVGDHAE